MKRWQSKVIVHKSRCERLFTKRIPWNPLSVAHSVIIPFCHGETWKKVTLENFSRSKRRVPVRSPKFNQLSKRAQFEKSQARNYAPKFTLRLRSCRSSRSLLTMQALSTGLYVIYRSTKSRKCSAHTTADWRPSLSKFRPQAVTGSTGQRLVQSHPPPDDSFTS